jgi:hypothetical protein
MRGAGVLVAVVLAMSVGSGCGEALANGQGAREWPALQSAMLEWVRLSAGSPQFIFGTLLGLACAEVAHLVWRLVWKLSRVIAIVVEFVLRYGLVAAGLGAGLYYGSVYWAFG